ncbi:PD40 domain-containing protein [Caenimonas aquaedulcis]|uniref:PD40 domain-containing protein n=1 Tax=Caenimonas aquaedulcis TaxID=2793270 RepID=A0A931H7L4_9BURK|nr:PD40 domain-containing protein [Caenimonas aquaedulcis]MBG9390164.1 PD40 domain-containing protein [Caenimonas aquaedulcis]
MAFPISSPPFSLLRKLPTSLAAIAMACAVGQAHATYPGTNGVIVFEGTDGNYRSTIARVAPFANAKPTFLAVGGKSPVASPSGKKIAYWLPGTNTSTIHVMNIDGTNDVQLTSGASDSYPVWTPDGGSIFFVRNGNQLWFMRSDGFGAMFMRQLVAPDQGASELAWAPDALHRLSFSYTSNFNIYSGTTGSTADTLLVHGQAPSYEPSGIALLYQNLDDQYVHEIGSNGLNDQALKYGLTYNTGGPSVVAPDNTLLAGAISGYSLLIRDRAGNNTALPYASTNSTDWSRVPQNCYETTTQGGGGFIPGYADFYAERCAVAVMPDGGQASGGVLMQAAAIGPDRRLYVATQKLNSSGVPTWGSFALAPGVSGNAAGVVASKVAIAGAKDGSSQLVIMGADGTVYHSMRYANGTWPAGGFQPLMNGGSVFQARDVAITISASSSTSPGDAQVIANGIQVGSVYHRVRWSNATWSDWAEVPGAAGLNTRQLAIAAGEDGNTNVLATVVQPDGTSLIKRQIRYPNSWDPSFVNVAIPAGTTLSALDTQIALTVTTGQSPTAQLVYTDVNGAAWLQQRGNPLYQSSWTGQTNNASLATGGTRAVSISGKPNGVANSEVMLVRTSAQ